MQENLQTIVNRGSEAAQIVESEVYKSAFNETREELIRLMIDTPVRDAEAREKYHLMIKMLDKVQIALTEHINSGKIAKEELEYQKTLTERVIDMMKGFA